MFVVSSFNEDPHASANFERKGGLILDSILRETDLVVQFALCVVEMLLIFINVLCIVYLGLNLLDCIK